MWSVFGLPMSSPATVALVTSLCVSIRMADWWTRITSSSVTVRFCRPGAWAKSAPAASEESDKREEGHRIYCTILFVPIAASSLSRDCFQQRVDLLLRLLRLEELLLVVLQRDAAA